MGRSMLPKAGIRSGTSGMWETGVWGVSQGCALPRSTGEESKLAGVDGVFLQSWQRISIREDSEASSLPVMVPLRGSGSEKGPGPAQG